MGKPSRDKGARNERDLVQKLRDAGLDAKRVPLSGACDGFKGDVVVDGYTPERREPAEIILNAPMTRDERRLWERIAHGPTLTIECKVRANGFKQIYAWLPEQGVLAIRSDRSEWLIVERLSDWMERL